MKVHILSSFPGESAGKTKDLDEITAKELIRLEQAVVAKDGSEHPETKGKSKPQSEAEAEAQRQADEKKDKADKAAAERKDKTDKAATGAATK